MAENISQAWRSIICQNLREYFKESGEFIGRGVAGEAHAQGTARHIVGDAQCL